MEAFGGDSWTNFLARKRAPQKRKIYHLYFIGTCVPELLSHLVTVLRIKSATVERIELPSLATDLTNPIALPLSGLFIM